MIFKPYTLEETVIEKALHANECEEMNKGIHCKSGTPFMGLAVNARLSISNEEGRTFLIPDANSCIDYEPHIKDDPDLQWIWFFFSLLMSHLPIFFLVFIFTLHHDPLSAFLSNFPPPHGSPRICQMRFSEKLSLCFIHTCMLVNVVPECQGLRGLNISRFSGPSITLWHLNANLRFREC